MGKTGRLLTDSSILYRCSQKYYDKVLDAYHLGSGQLPFLIFIYENEGITMNGLAQLGCYDKGTVTKGVQRLEEVGYVTIEVNPNDKRVRTLRTTAKAKQIIAQIYLIRQQWWDQITKNMSEEEAALFESLQSKAVANALEFLAEEEQASERVGIFGIQKMTLLDYPGKIASTLFTGGCNFRCPFCQNSDLVFLAENMAQIPKEELFDFLQRRQGTLEGICISGGEPLLQPGIEDFLRKIKELGYPVKLDTNGSFPEQLQHLIDVGLIDYVAMDLKNCRERYAETVGLVKLDLGAIEKSVALLMQDRIPYEFRTTVVKELHTEDDMRRLGEWIQGARRLVLQQFVDSERVIQQGLHACTKEEMEAFREILLPGVPDTELRGL